MRFGIVGTGWRARFYLELARVLPSRFTVTGIVTRSPDRVANWDVPAFESVSQLRDSAFVVTSVPRDVNPQIVSSLVAMDMPVLSETPALTSMRPLCAGGLVQVAEQYPLQPLHFVRAELVRAGVIGTPVNASVSSTHDYHAVALLRDLLGVGLAPVRVTAHRHTEQVLRGPDRAGWPESAELAEADRTFAFLDWDGRTGTYDFTDGQWWHPLRTHRHAVRGTHGEIVDEEITRMADHRTPVRSLITRRQTGLGGNLEGFALDTLSVDGEVRWRNPYFPARLSDEEIAIATLLDRMGAWVAGEGPPPYPLAQACHDQAISEAIAESWRTGRPVSVESGDL
ncbi:hypothetical protein Lesp02_06780 [Lentzea sp. NBRC 105346]|uniref:hypothetical protein n=1 Tax=Lentzea sp. NBRC 105346 TaxID=3032205 RepID=UPI00249FB387|nr:hypothetical protein [Lentzea sp. NBRC 105346]GLZ28488.1 hypothetical protein Lesp02_06780 [Lentzea sp. NBRC 105346]